MKNYYKIIGVPMTATDDEIRNAYRRLAKKYHPDVNPNNKSVAEKFAEVNEAHEVLSDPEKRAAYDAQIKAELAQQQQQTQVRQNVYAQNPYAHHTARQSTRGHYSQGATVGGSSRMDVIANAMRARAQAEEAARAARNAQNIQNMQNAQTQGYNSGYTKGYTDAQNATAAQITQLNAQITQLNLKVSQANSAAREKDEKIQKLESVLKEERMRYEEQIDELLSRIDSVQNKTETAKTDTDGEIKAKLDRVTAQMRTVEANLIAEHEKKDALESENQRLREEIKKLRATNDDLRTQLDEWQTYGAQEEEAENLRYVIDSWKERLKETKKWLKNTHYGQLGTYYWATGDQITAAFEKVKKRYAKKVLAGDETFKEKLRDAGIAYKVLSDDRERRQYNLSLSISTEDIEHARADEHEYLKAVNTLKEYDHRAEIQELIDELHADADAGDGAAANELGEIFLAGEGVEKDVTAAINFFNMAIELGEPNGKFNLGICYLNGEGVEADALKGVRLIKEAAAEGSESAIEFEKMQG